MKQPLHARPQQFVTRLLSLLNIKDAAYEGRDAEGNMTPEAKEKLVDDMKQAYDDTPKAVSYTHLVNVWGIKTPKNTERVLEYIQYGQHPLVEIAPEMG